jgi:gamma-glutamylcyclotransferase (GGCT)/AIG2-like uncharacterized protein YtfP
VAEHLFLYGTLQPELAPRRLRGPLGRLRFVGRGSVKGRLHDLGAYPALILGGESRVRGAVFAIPDPAILTPLDLHEGFHPGDAESLFLRVEAPVQLESGESLPAFLYVYNREAGSAPLVPDGDYLAHLRRTRPIPEPGVPVDTLPPQS